MNNTTTITKADGGSSCQVHGPGARTANRGLIAMVLAAFGLIIWHVWVHGPSLRPASARTHFAQELLVEFRDLLLGSHGVLAELWSILPYFLAGVLLAGYLRTAKLAVKLQARLKRFGVLSIVVASFIGIISPLCACGTLTTAISLLFAGLPLAPVMALLVTSPLLSPSTYLLTLNDLGPEWTVVRTVAAFSMGIFAGVVTHLLKDRGFDTRSVFIEGALPRGDFHDQAYPDERLRCNCRERFGNRVAARTGNTVIIWLAKSSEMLWLVGKYVLVGVAIGAVVEHYLPPSWIERLFRSGDGMSILWVTLGSVPVFLHQISASSILYHIKSSLAGTLDSGAALAFLIGGPVTAMPTMVLFWTIFKKRLFFLYLFICIAGTLLIAFAFRLFLFVPHTDLGNPLLRSVAAISGGPAAAIEKLDRKVRIVMDPEGTNIIALVQDDLSGQGGVVFDGSLARMTTPRYDDVLYRNNIAQWLESTSLSPFAKNILIVGLGDDDGRALAGLKSLEERGFSVTAAGRGSKQVLSGDLLRSHGQLWLLIGEEPGRAAPFSPAELEAIAGFHRGGGSIMIAVNPAGAQNANALSRQLGVLFKGAVMIPERIETTRASAFLQGGSDLLGKFLKLFRKG